MKTRRNHRKTTMGRRRRVVKQQRGKTHNYHHRKGTVSSGRRHKFFKRGGASIDDIINTFIVGIEPSVKSAIGNNIKLTTENVYDNPSNDTIDKPIERIVNDTQIKFVIVKPISNSSKQSVYIYVYNPTTMKYELQKKIMITNGNDNMGSYYPDVATAIFDALKQYKP